MKYFITEEYIKEFSPILSNVDMTMVLPFTRSVAEMNIKSMLGSYFYNDLLTKYNTIPTGLSNDEKILVDHIKPIIIWRVTSEMALASTYQLTNKGIVTQNGDNVESVEKSEVTFVMKHYLQNSEWYEQQLNDYLILNKNLYPAFISDNNKNSVIKSTISNRADYFGSDMDFI